jgi:hypothetical protein
MTGSAPTYGIGAGHSNLPRAGAAPCFAQRILEGLKQVGHFEQPFQLAGTGPNARDVKIPPLDADDTFDIEEVRRTGGQRVRPEPDRGRVRSLICRSAGLPCA